MEVVKKIKFGGEIQFRYGMTKRTAICPFCGTVAVALIARKVCIKNSDCNHFIPEKSTSRTAIFRGESEMIS